MKGAVIECTPWGFIHRWVYNPHAAFSTWGWTLDGWHWDAEQRENGVVYFPIEAVLAQLQLYTYWGDTASVFLELENGVRIPVRFFLS